MHGQYNVETLTCLHAYRDCYSKSIHRVMSFRQSFRYKDFFSDTGPVLDAASSRKATTTYPTRMRLAAAMAEMAAHVVEPT